MSGKNTSLAAHSDDELRSLHTTTDNARMACGETLYEVSRELLARAVQSAYPEATTVVLFAERESGGDDYGLRSVLDATGGKLVDDDDLIEDESEQASEAREFAEWVAYLDGRLGDFAVSLGGQR